MGDRVKWGADWPNVPRERGRFLEHRKRRVRRRAVVRLCQRFRQFCRLVKAGAIPMEGRFRRHYEQFAQQSIAELVRDELQSRDDAPECRPELPSRTALRHIGR